MNVRESIIMNLNKTETHNNTATSIYTGTHNNIAASTHTETYNNIATSIY